MIKITRYIGVYCLYCTVYYMYKRDRHHDNLKQHSMVDYKSTSLAMPDPLRTDAYRLEIISAVL